MGNIVEGTRAAEFIAFEQGGNYSRDEVTILTGQNLKAGAVMGKITAGAATAGAPVGTGDGTIGAVTVGVDVKPGVYKLTAIEPGANVGTFLVEDPDGIEIGSAVVAVAFTSTHIGFTIADGAADFVAGDTFDITVAAGTAKFVELDPAAVNGAANAAGILFAAVDATSADKGGTAIVRDATVVDSALLWPTGISAGDKTAAIADLEKLGILLRKGV